MDLSFSPAMLELMRRPEQPLSVEHLRYIAPHLFQQVSRLWDLVLEKARLLGQQDVDSVRHDECMKSSWYLGTGMIIDSRSPCAYLCVGTLGCLHHA
mgnify:CR=1 FL=1